MQYNIKYNSMHVKKYIWIHKKSKTARDTQTWVLKEIMMAMSVHFHNPKILRFAFKMASKNCNTSQLIKWFEDVLLVD